MADYILYKQNHPKDIYYHYAKSDSCQIEIHLHDSFEIFMALSDNIKYFIEGQVYDLSKGDLIITNDSEVHRPQVTDNGAYERCFIQFKPQLFHHLMASDYNPLRIFTHRSPGKGNKLALSKENSEQIQPIQNCLNTIKNLYEQDNPRSNLLTYSTLLQLLVYLDDLYAVQIDHSEKLKIMDARVKKMLILIEMKFQTKISLGSLCDELFVDKYYMSHLFKEATGFTIMEYIQSKRIQLAKKLLLQGISSTEVCYACAFEDYSNFYKTFKKLVSCSPREYRNRAGI